MMKKIFSPLMGLVFALTLILSAVAQESPLRVVVSTPDLKSLAERLGGGNVRVFCFTKGPEDPHVMEILPSFVREMQQADLFIQVGLGLENAWIEDLLTRAANERVKPGGPANLNLGSGVRRLAEDDGADAVAGSFHEEGNPHYLLDPVEGLKAARRICDKFVAVRPGGKAAFEELHAKFVRAWAVTYLGETITSRAELGKLEDFESSDALEAYLTQLTRDVRVTDGVAGLLAPFKGTVVVGDHDLWPYFARRYELTVLGYLEPSPGVPPTTKHLGELIGKMRTARVRTILTAPYFDQRHGRFVSQRTDAKVVPMVHQCGGRPGTDDYLDMLKFNATQFANALKEVRP
jgi:ABC-type Zn uptake system ZnuABC Zn-binding protein ZnuA